MTDGPDNLVLRILRQIDERTARMSDRLDMLTERMGSVEHKPALWVTDQATTNSRLDGLDNRLARIERRLELIDPALAQ
jgi:uncharacterized coiled-coil protein SlyX